MQINNTNQTSFKSLYTLRGEADILDDICSYFGRIQRKTQGRPDEFNFLSIRTPISLNPSSKTESSLSNHHFFDLFMTSHDEKIAEPIMRDVVLDTIGLEQQERPIIKHFKAVLDRLNELDERIRAGKPILGLNIRVLRTHLERIFDFSSLREIKAEDAFNGLRADRFDISQGTIGDFCN